ncbi:hypothetical protein DM860_011294 [Cuscuta australis]|uniref:RRM domain-containing protein n=1 Tax=Cuscuta australis TaxID=267555 RepID=A0A328DQ37_9ASTE|nr:hypothetical protein DM860_011294 [Cuscuta australis]
MHCTLNPAMNSPSLPKNGGLISLPQPLLAAAKSHHFSLACRPNKHRLSSSSSSSSHSFLLSLRCRNPNLHFRSQVPVAASQPEDDEGTFVFDEQEGDGEGEGDLSGADFNWVENVGGDEVEEGEEQGGILEAVGDARGSGDVFAEDSGEYTELPEEAKLFVGNLPFDVDSEALAMIFQKAGTVEIAEVIYNRDIGRSRGFGFVTMSTTEEAERAIEKFNGYELNGRDLAVKKADPRGIRPERRLQPIETSHKIYVGNIPWSLDESQLERMFSEHGKVVSAFVVRERDSGRSRGFGFVVMSSEAEMNDAVAGLDGKNVEGRTIRVSVALARQRGNY